MRFAFLFTLLSLPLAARAQAGLSDAWIAIDRASAPNSNLQCFSPANVSVSAGNLVIVTKRQRSNCKSFDLPLAPYDYTSGFVLMRHFNFRYGTVEFKARFGGGDHTGAWPIVWMEDATCQASDPTGTDDRCNGQEIDIAEILHGDFSAVNEQIHVDNNGHNDGCTGHTSDVSKNFHVYDLVWSPGSLIFKIDGATTCEIHQRYVPNGPMYIKIDNFAGDFGGPINDDTLPWTTLIDYVKVTQGNKAIFFDDFDGQPAQQSTPATKAKGHSGRSHSAN